MVNWILKKCNLNIYAVFLYFTEGTVWKGNGQEIVLKI